MMLKMDDQYWSVVLGKGRAIKKGSGQDAQTGVLWKRVGRNARESRHKPENHQFLAVVHTSGDCRQVLRTQTSLTWKRAKTSGAKADVKSSTRWNVSSGPPASVWLFWLCAELVT
jgi:hypothetical protein